MQFISYHEFSKVMKSCHNSTLSTDSLPTFTDSVMNSTDSLLICTDLLLNSTDSLLTSTSKTLVKLSSGSPHTSTDSYWLSTTSIDSLLTSSDCTDHYCNYHAAHKTGQAQNCKNMNVNNMVITQCSQLLSSEHKWNTKGATNIYLANTNVLGSDINVWTLDWIQFDRFSLATKINLFITMDKFNKQSRFNLQRLG